MRKYRLFSAFSSLEGLEPRVSLTSFSVGAVAAAVSTFNPNGHRVATSDPIPNPEPAPGPDPGDNPPVVYPVLPPSGPSGPGS
jgi:hypothetical protein